MIGTDENRAVLHVEVIFWGGKRKAPPAWSVESIVPILLSQEPLNIWGCASWMERSVVHLMKRLWVMFSPFTRTLWTTARWKTMRNF